MILSGSKPLALAVLLTFLSSCKVSTRPQKDKETAVDSNAELLIYIQQGPCKGKCPVYEASFYSGRKMVYEGKDRMPLIGKYQYLLPEGLTKNLIFEAVKQNLKLLPDSLPVPDGAPVTVLKVVINGKLKIIRGSTRGTEPGFNGYIKLLHSEVSAMITEQEGIKIP